MRDSHDVLVVGAGLAGMRSAIEAFDAGADVAVVSKLHPVRSHSGAAEGGINAALGNASPDSPEEHAYDTVKGSDYLGDQDAIDILCEEAPADVYQLENWGAVFSRTEDGRIAQRAFGAAGEPRTAYAADITGHVLVNVLYEQLVKRGIRVYEEFFVWQLAVVDGRCCGVVCWDLLRGGVTVIEAKTVILCTGGAGRLYTGTTNAYACTGDGMALALRAGVPLKDMEMMQFHPTTLAPTGVLITEGCRGEGAYLFNSDGERFLTRYAPNAMELASRDVISRAEQTEIDEGRGVDGNVFLDLRHLGAETILEKLHGTRELSMTFVGIDPIEDPIPVRPGAHYHMGGIDMDIWGRTELEGLYAAGECACVSLHGANRLGGNALMETITYGRRTGRHAAERALTEAAVRPLPGLGPRGCRPRAQGAARPRRGGAPLAHARRARRDDARELRRLPARGADAAAGRDRRRTARALRARRRRRQGQRLQQRPHADARARLPARARRLHGRVRSRAQGEPRRPRAAVRLSGARRRELHAPHDRALARRAPRARLETRYGDEVGATGEGLLMRRVAAFTLVLAATLALAACGGGKARTSNGAQPPASASFSLAALEKTGKTSAHVAFTGSVEAAGQNVTLSGSGDLDSAAHEGTMELAIALGTQQMSVSLVLDGKNAYASSSLFSSFLPSGKKWLKVPVDSAAKLLGPESFALTSAGTLPKLENVQKVGPATIDGTPTTEYSGKIDLSKLPLAARAALDAGNVTFGPVDVWIGGDGYVHRVQLTLSASTGGKQAKVAFTTTLSKFGENVSVTPPPASETVDAGNMQIPGLGGTGI